MPKKQVQFNRPVTLTNEAGEQATFGKGVHAVDESFVSGWYFEALTQENAVAILADVKESGEGSEGGGADILEGSVKEIVEALQALSVEALQALAQREAEGKNRKGVLDAINAVAKSKA